MTYLSTLLIYTLHKEEEDDVSSYQEGSNAYSKYQTVDNMILQMLLVPKEVTKE